MTQIDKDVIAIHRTVLRTLALAYATLSVWAVVTCGQTAATGAALTVQRLYSSPSLSGALTRGVEWSPDSKEISYLQTNAAGAKELWTMDAATGAKKVLVKAETMSAVTQPEKTKAVQATGLGRVEPENYQWAPHGDALLFIGSSNLVLLDLKMMTPKTLLSGGADIQDVKFSPDEKWVS